MNEKAVDILKAIIAIIILTILNIYLPFMSIFVLIVWPIPIVVTSIKHGSKSASIVVIFSALLNSYFFSPLMGLFAIIGFGLIGFVLGLSVKEGFSPLKTLILTILAVFFSQILILFVSSQFLGYNLGNMLDETMNVLLQTPQIDEIILNQVKSVIKAILPAIVFVSSIMVGIMNYYVSLWYLNNKGREIKKYKSIRLWRFPRWLVSLGILGTLLFTQNTIILNINIILFFFAFLQGFNVGLYFIEKKGYLILTMLYIMLVFMIPVLPFILIFVGLLDMWFDFRKLKKEKI